MRIHAKDNIARKIKSVMLDNEDITKRCFCVDDEKGTAHCHKVNAEGRFYIDPETQQPAEEILHGKVEIIFKEEPK